MELNILSILYKYPRIIIYIKLISMFIGSKYIIQKTITKKVTWLNVAVLWILVFVIDIILNLLQYLLFAESLA